VKRVLKITGYVLTGIAALLVVVAGVSQTQFFRDRLRAYALAKLDSLLIANVTLGEFHGNLITGFSVDTVAIALDGEALLQARHVELRYSLLGLPGKRLSLSHVSLDAPIIQIRADRQGRWNFQRMLRTSPADTGAAGPFDWDIAVDRFVIENGSIHLVDSAALFAPGHPRPVDTAFVEYHDVHLEHVNLAMSAMLSAAEKNVNIEECSFVSSRPALVVEHLAVQVVVNSHEARVREFRLRTGGSAITLAASLRQVDLLGGFRLEDLQHKPVTLDLRGDDLNFDELHMFIPEIAFLRGPVGLTLHADGEFGKLGVRQLDIRRGETKLHFTGSVSHLHTPENLYLDVRMAESTLSPGDPLALMPSFDLPDFTGMGNIQLMAEFVGTPSDFLARLHLSSAAGDCPNAEMRMHLGGPGQLTYDGQCSVSGVDLARVFNNPSLSSHISSNITIRGEGLELARLKTTVNINCDSSEFRGKTFRTARLSAGAAHRQVEGWGEFSLGSASANLHATLDDRQEDAPSFSVDGDVAGLNLAEFLHDPNHDTDIRAHLNAHGTGLSLARVSGTLLADLSGSRFRDYTWDSGMVQLTVDQHDPQQSSLVVESSIADASINGMYDLRSVIDLGQYEIDNVMNAMGERLAPFDSTLAESVNRRHLQDMEQRFAHDHRGDVDAEYRVHVKDLDLLAVALGERLFNGQAEVAGVLRGNYLQLMARGTAHLKEFFVGSADAGMLIQNGTVTFGVDTLNASTVLEDIDAAVTARISRVNINRGQFDSLQIDLAQHSGASRFIVAGIVDSSTRIALRGTGRVVADSVALNFEQLGVAYKGCAWEADSGASAIIAADGILVDHLTLRRDKQTVAVRASLTSGAAIAASLSASDLDLDDLRYFIAGEEQTVAGHSFNGNAAVSVNITGTLDKPRYAARISTGEIRYRNIPFGYLSGIFDYADNLLTMDVNAWVHRDSIGGAADLNISGTLPVDFALRGAENLLPDAPLNLTIRTRGMQMGVLDPLLPTFNELSGTVTSDLQVVGTWQKPDYQGSIDLTGCSFLFVPNNVTYLLDGKFRPVGDRIKVLSARMRNLPADVNADPENGIEITGDFALRGLSMEDFNLDMKGNLLVVKETTRKSALSVYGSLAVDIGERGLHFSGSLEHSLLQGSLLITNSRLVFPPTREVTSNEGLFNVPVVFVDDTTQHVQQTGTTALDRYFGRQNGSRKRNGLQTEVATPSFTDGLRYNLDIEASGGNAEIRMIFNPNTGEELVAAINGKFLISGDGKRWFGDLVVERGYYFFFKRLNAEGRIRYTGDFMNPVLDLTARYEGTRTVGDTTEQVVVTFGISGTRDNPKVEHHMTIDQVDYAVYRGLKSNDVQSDAIAFVITGSFPISDAQKNDVASGLSSTARQSLLSGAASFITGTLSEVLRDQTGFIQSAEFSYGSGRGVLESVDFRLSGTAWKGYWRYGGRILEDPLANANFSLIYSVGSIVERPSLNNLMLELERRVEPGFAGQTANDLRRVNSAKLFYRFSF
jgi:hypothetical protein